MKKQKLKNNLDLSTLTEIKLDFEQTKLPFDNKIKRKIRQLESDKNFHKIILAYRKKVGIPSKGLDPMTMWRTFPTKAERTNLSFEGYRYTKYLMKKFGLGYGFFMPLQDYVTYGNYMTIDAVAGDYRFGAVIDYNENGVVIRIYPEATQSDIQNLIKLKWPEIQNAFKFYYPSMIKTPRLKEHTSDKTAEFVYGLYKRGVFKYNGTRDASNETGYLKEQKMSQLEEVFEKKNLTLPKQDQRKKIILRYNRISKLKI